MSQTKYPADGTAMGPSTPSVELLGKRHFQRFWVSSHRKIEKTVLGQRLNTEETLELRKLLRMCSIDCQGLNIRGTMDDCRYGRSTGVPTV